VGSRGAARRDLCTDEDHLHNELEEMDNSNYDSVRLIDGRMVVVLSYVPNNHLPFSTSLSNSLREWQYILISIIR
jgi:hypothetical protein